MVKAMSAISGEIQTVEDIYQLLRTAVLGKRPVRATYDGLDRWLCPHRLGKNREGQLRVLCYQYGGQSGSGLQSPGSAANWRCIAVEKLSKAAVLEGAWYTAPNYSRPQSCVVEMDVDVED
jgi:hypothetical protein